MKALLTVICYTVVLAFCLGLSYFGAMIGHPMAVWLWRDILGWM